MTPKRTLAMIGLFVALMLGSFIWFVATWNPAAEEPVSTLTTRAEGVLAA